MISRIDHVSLAVKDFEKAKNFFMEILGAIPCTNAEDDNLRYYWEMFSVGDLSRMELIKATGEGSFLDNFLESRTNGAHHITVETPDLNQFRKNLEEKGVPYFGYRKASDNWKELFIHPRDAFGILIQVAEMNSDDWLSDAVKFPPDQRWEIEKTGDGANLILAHPGGGKARFPFIRAEIQNLINDLEEIL
ncbi:MAG: VOC family protein [Candidatus Adiutricales bacterium]